MATYCTWENERGARHITPRTWQEENWHGCPKNYSRTEIGNIQVYYSSSMLIGIGKYWGPLRKSQHIEVNFLFSLSYTPARCANQSSCQHTDKSQSLNSWQRYCIHLKNTICIDKSKNVKRPGIIFSYIYLM